MENRKLCTKCGIEKTLLQFYKDSTKSDGFYSSCRSCCTPKEREKYIKLVKKQKSKEYYEKNKLKAFARTFVRSALKKKKIIKKNCFKCNNQKTEAHHYLGYAREHWLDILWLCKTHHNKTHGKKS